MKRNKLFGKIKFVLGVFGMTCMLAACGKPLDSPITLDPAPMISEESSQNVAETTVQDEKEETTSSDAEQISQEGSDSQESSEHSSGNPEASKYLVVIDAGHQQKGNSEKEPVGPGATEMKAKVASGTQGVVTKIPEYELTLAVSKKLEKILTDRGYQVLMVRDKNDVNISNAERAEVANEAKADIFVRVHANGSENSEASGVETLCQTKNNPYNADFYKASRKLADCLLDAVADATGCNKRHVIETDTMSGINWCQTPVTIVEMGFMSNPAEDELMATEEYRDKIAEGIANGIDAYFGL